MAKQVGYEVIAQRAVCVDFSDGRTVSYRPGHRFYADATNASVQRLLRTKDVRVLAPNESVPAMPVKLGAPQRVQDVVNARAQLAAAQKSAAAKLSATKKAQPAIEVAKPTPVPTKKKPKKPETSSDMPGLAADL